MIKRTSFFLIPAIRRGKEPIFGEEEEDRKMVSEIEIVEDGGARDQEAASSAGDAAGEEVLRNDVFTAAAYGDLEKLQRLVESEGCSVSEPDSLGYYALQWAALNNRTAAAQYIIEVMLHFVFYAF